MLQLYKENLEALNAEFGMHRHPPSMYLSVSQLRPLSLSLSLSWSLGLSRALVHCYDRIE